MGWFKHLLTLFLMPLLPERYRKRWPWEPPFPIGVAMYATAFLHIFLGALFWGLAFTSYQKTFGDMTAAAIADPKGHGEVGLLTWYGVIGFFAFFFTWKGFLAYFYLVEAVLRFVAAAMNSSMLGTLFLAVPLWLVERVTGEVKEAQTTRRYGKAGVPDSILQVADGLLVRSTRPHPEWHRLVAFHYKETLYRLESEGEGFNEGRPCFEYRFRPWPEQEIVRGIIVLG